jgi:hypothetical protein
MDLPMRRSVYVVNAEIHDASNEHAVFHRTLLVLSVKDPAEICA